MNKKVFRVMLTLIITFLVGLYVLKIFFPEQFMMSIQNEQIKAIGAFVDSHSWLRYILAGITSFITYWLYCCACSGKKWLKWYECLYILGFVVLSRLINFWDTNVDMALQYSAFLVLPALTGGDLKKCAIVATVHYLAQTMSLTIRNLAMYLTTANYATVLLMTLECYFWLLLFYTLFNYKNKEVKAL